MKVLHCLCLKESHKYEEERFDTVLPLDGSQFKFTRCRLDIKTFYSYGFGVAAIALLSVNEP